jgi:SAM-dependent methyltransferase
MSRNNQQVKSFFDQTHLYLKNSYGIRIRTGIVREFIGKLDYVSILDVGCGDGSISLPLLAKSNHLTLIDLSNKMLNIAKKNTPQELQPFVKYLNLDFMIYDFKQTFDLILCLGVLAHIPSVEHAIIKISDLLRPGGSCILQFTDQSQFFSRLNNFYYSIYRRFADQYRYSVNLMTYRQIRTLLVSNQLQLRRECRYSVLLPGFGKLPDQALFRYQLFTLQNSWISRIGTDVVMLVTKNELPT